MQAWDSIPNGTLGVQEVHENYAVDTRPALVAADQVQRPGDVSGVASRPTGAMAPSGRVRATDAEASPPVLGAPAGRRPVRDHDERPRTTRTHAGPPTCDRANDPRLVRLRIGEPIVRPLFQHWRNAGARPPTPSRHRCVLPSAETAIGGTSIARPEGILRDRDVLHAIQGTGHRGAGSPSARGSGSGQRRNGSISTGPSRNGICKPHRDLRQHGQMRMGLRLLLPEGPCTPVRSPGAARRGPAVEQPPDIIRTQVDTNLVERIMSGRTPLLMSAPVGASCNAGSTGDAQFPRGAPVLSIPVQHRLDERLLLLRRGSRVITTGASVWTECDETQ